MKHWSKHKTASKTKHTTTKRTTLQQNTTEHNASEHHKTIHNKAELIITVSDNQQARQPTDHLIQEASGQPHKDIDTRRNKCARSHKSMHVCCSERPSLTSSHFHTITCGSMHARERMQNFMQIHVMCNCLLHACADICIHMQAIMQKHAHNVHTYMRAHPHALMERCTHTAKQPRLSLMFCLPNRPGRVLSEAAQSRTSQPEALRHRR
jgi:hypothetical protein